MEQTEGTVEARVFVGPCVGGAEPGTGPGWGEGLEPEWEDTRAARRGSRGAWEEERRAGCGVCRVPGGGAGAVGCG